MSDTRVPMGPVVNSAAPGVKYSGIANIGDRDAYCIEVDLVKVGAAGGNFEIEASLDGINFYPEDPDTTVVFVDTVAKLYIIRNATYFFARVKYTNTSGEFNVETFISGKKYLSH